MFKIICEENDKELVLDTFLKEFTNMCICGISVDIDKLEEEQVNGAKEMISMECIEEYEDIDGGFEIEFLCPNEIGFLLLNLFDMGNTYVDSFTSNYACMKNVIEKLVEKVPNVVVEGSIEYDDGISCISENISMIEGKIISKWDDEEDDIYEDDV